MAKPLEQDQLQPSLLDRLTDEEPEKRVESRERRVLTMIQLRECVIRDLTWLFNTGNMASTEDLTGSPHVASSVLNYGIPGLAGKTISNLEKKTLEQKLRQAIWDFEPRIIRDSVKVRMIVKEDRKRPSFMTFDIEGKMWGQPIPLQLYLKTEVDLETGDVTIAEKSGPGAH